MYNWAHVFDFMAGTLLLCLFKDGKINTFGVQNFLLPRVNKSFMVNVDAHLSNENVVKYLQSLFYFFLSWPLDSKEQDWNPSESQPMQPHAHTHKKERKTTIRLFTCAYTHALICVRALLEQQKIHKHIHYFFLSKQWAWKLFQMMKNTSILT